MSEDIFVVKKSVQGYRVELCRNGNPYVTFLDGLSKAVAQREARNLTALWRKISSHERLQPLSTAETE